MNDPLLLKVDGLYYMPGKLYFCIIEGSIHTRAFTENHVCAHHSQWKFFSTHEELTEFFRDMNAQLSSLNLPPVEEVFRGSSIDFPEDNEWFEDEDPTEWLGRAILEGAK